MKKYLIEREIPGVHQLGAEELKGAAATSNAALAQLGPKVQFPQKPHRGHGVPDIAEEPGADDTFRRLSAAAPSLQRAGTREAPMHGNVAQPNHTWESDYSTIQPESIIAWVNAGPFMGGNRVEGVEPWSLQRLGVIRQGGPKAT